MKSEHQEINLQRVGMKRRGKEVRRMKVMTGLMVLFLTLTLLFQDNMKQYQLQMNYRSYGEWLMREPVSSSYINHPYLEQCGEIWTGGGIYRAKEGETPDTMQIEPTDNSLYTGKTLGRLTTDIAKTGHIRLYEGTLPQKDDEIAMELSTLQALGCDYDLGQEITFYTVEDENVSTLIMSEKKMELTKVTFTLVGTIRSYTAEWNEGDALPNAIITQNAFARIRMQRNGYRFWKLKDEYVDENVASFAIELADAIKKEIVKDGKIKGGFEENGFSINQFAYYNAFWSNRTMYRNMTIILIVMGASVMSYLMSSYLSKRKKFYYRMREIGATVSQVFRMTVYECIYSVLLTGFIVLVLSYGMSVLLVFAVAKAAAIPFFYVFRFQTLAMVIVCVALVLSLAMLCAHLILRGKRLTDNRNRLSRLAEKRIRRRARRKRKCRLSIREMEKRYRMSHSVSVLFIRIIGIGVCVSVLACMMQINRNVNGYHYTCELYTDFHVNSQDILISTGNEMIPIKPYENAEGKLIDKELMGISQTTSSMRECIPESFLQDVRELTGVRHLSYAAYDTLHWFDWKGKGESEHYKTCMCGQTDGLTQDGAEIQIDETTEKGREYLEKIDKQWFYEGRYYHDCAAVWEDLEPHLKKTKANYQDLCDGDEVILFEQGLVNFTEENQYTGEVMNVEHYIEKDSTLQEGDTLTIHTEGRDVTVKIGAILLWEEFDNKYGTAPYSIVGSEALAKKIAAEDNFTFGWNRVWIDFNAFWNSEATDKIITRQCVQNNLGYDSGAEYIRAAFTRLVQSALVYGTLAVIITVLYLFIVSCVLQEEGRKKHDKLKAFHQLGVPLKQFRRLGLRNGLMEVLYLLLSIPILCMVWTVYLHADYTNDLVAYTSIFFHKTIYEMTEQKYIFYALFDQINLVWVGMYLLVLSVFLIIMHVRKMHL